ncbi:hypothetical protein BDB01DRAFT_839773 [Pilobolus umbonatus]|nr:hypothetical protein BDB01DRAFT_839773 [Pilobolus umbonatus]
MKFVLYLAAFVGLLTVSISAKKPVPYWKNLMRCQKLCLPSTAHVIHGGDCVCHEKYRVLKKTLENLKVCGNFCSPSTFDFRNDMCFCIQKTIRRPRHNLIDLRITLIDAPSYISVFSGAFMPCKLEVQPPPTINFIITRHETKAEYGEHCTDVTFINEQLH